MVLVLVFACFEHEFKGRSSLCESDPLALAEVRKQTAAIFPSYTCNDGSITGRLPSL